MRSLNISWRSIFGNRFILFLFVGGINTLFGYGLYALMLFIGLHYALAALVATIGGVLFNFKTTGAIVFGNGNNALIFRFVAVYLVVYVVNTGVLKIFNHYAVSLYIAGAVMLLPMAVLAFLLQRKFVFTSS